MVVVHTTFVTNFKASERKLTINNVENWMNFRLLSHIDLFYGAFFVILSLTTQYQFAFVILKRTWIFHLLCSTEQSKSFRFGTSELMLRICSVSLFGVKSCLSRNYCPTSDLTALLKISQIRLQRIIDNRISKVCVDCKNRVFWVSKYLHIFWGSSVPFGSTSFSPKVPL